MDLIYKDKDWLVINKPTGLSSQAAFPGDVGIEEWIALNWGEKVHVFSRLDKGTSGILILARNPQAAKKGADLHLSDKTRKDYIFLSHVDSHKIQKSSEWTVKSSVDGKMAETEFKRLGPVGEYFLYQATISRGRLHQIRRHAKESKISILGDEQYGGKRYPRLCLHCKFVSWPEIPQELVAPVPPSMGSLGDFKNDPNFLVSFDRRLRFYKNITDAFRCVHRGEMKALDCAIDYYGGYLCVWLYEEQKGFADCVVLLKPYLKKLTHFYDAKGCVIKHNVKNPHAHGLVQKFEVIGETPPDYFTVTEHGLKYQVTLTQGQHVGLFLDQRDNRLRLRQMATGKRVANLFSYTCSFSVAAAAAKCEVVFSVDVAQPCLDVGKNNFALNDLSDTGRGKFIKEDARVWLEKQVRKMQTVGQSSGFDVIVCDPPTFSSTKQKGLFSVSKEWTELALQCSQILNKNGIAFFSTNHREGSRQSYKEALQKQYSSVLDLVPPLDFPVLDSKSETVKLFFCQN